MSLDLVDLIVTAASRCVHEKAERGVTTIEVNVCGRDSRSNISTGLRNFAFDFVTRRNLFQLSMSPRSGERIQT